MSDYSVNLSTTEPNNYVGLIKLRQGDVASQSIQATITANGQLFNFDNLAVFFNAVLPDGNVVRDKVTEVDYVNSKLNYVVADSFLQEVAQVTAWFSFENGDKIIDSTKNFQYSVIAGWKECIPQGNYIYELSEIQREIEEIIGNKDFTSLISKIDYLSTEQEYLNNKQIYLNSKVDFLGQQKADKAEIDAKLASITSGSPNSVFSNIEELNAKYPNGTTGIMLTTSDGHWYWWNSISSKWQDGGVYQSATDKIRTRNATIASRNPVNINTTAKVIELPKVGYLAVEDGYLQYTIDTTDGFNISFDGDGFIYFDTLTNKIKVVEREALALDTDLKLGWFYSEQKNYFINTNYTVDGFKQTTGSLPFISRRGRLLSTKPIVIDRQSQTMHFQAGSAFMVITEDTSYNIRASIGDTILDLSANIANYLFFNPLTSKIESYTTSTKKPITLLPLGYINFGDSFAIDLDMNYVVDTYSPQGKFADKKATVIGDSTVNGDNGQGSTDQSWSWVSYLRFLCGFDSVTNLGVNGSRVAIQDGRSNSVVERCTAISNQDFVAVLGGVNDFCFNVPLGSLSAPQGNFDKKTFYGAYQSIVETVKTNNPKAKILLITPMKVNKSPWNSFVANDVGFKEIDYVNAIKEIGELYGIRVYDLYTKCGFSPFLDSDSAFTVDKLHPTAIGYKFIASGICSEINLM